MKVSVGFTHSQMPQERGEEGGMDRKTAGQLFLYKLCWERRLNPRCLCGFSSIQVIAIQGEISGCNWTFEMNSICAPEENKKHRKNTYK